MNIILLLLSICASSFQGVAQKIYLKKTNGEGTFFLGAIVSAVSAVFFICTLSDTWHIEQAVLPYSIGFAIFYAIGTIFFYLAIRYGSLVLSALVLSYSMIIPTFYGLIFLKEPSDTGFYIGLLLLMISLVFINFKKGNMQITFPWIICIFSAVIGNGMCSVIQKMQQVRFNGAYKNEFMIIALFVVFTVLLITTLIYERSMIKACFIKGLPWVLSAGFCNGMINLCTILLIESMATSLMFPLRSAGGLIFTTGVSYFIFREKLSRSQLIGLVFGTIAVVFLNI